MKKIYLLIVVIAIALVGGCLTMPGPTVTTANSGNTSSGSDQTEFIFDLNNPHNFLIYPAVGVAFNNVKGLLGGKGELQPALQTINVLNNEFLIRPAHAAKSPSEIIQYRVSINVKDKQLLINFIDIEPYPSGIMLYSDAEIRALRFDSQKIANQIKIDIEKVLETEASYKTAKQAFIANNMYLSRAFVSVTKMMEDEFLKTLFKDGEVTFSATISNVQKNEAAEFRNYSTLVTASLSDGSGRGLPFAYINFYTSAAEYTRLSPRQQVSLTGTFVRMEPVTGSRRFIMTK